MKANHTVTCFLCPQLLHDYSSRVSLSLNMVKTNFEDSLQPLSSVFSVSCPKSELDKIRIYHKIQEYFEDDGDNNFPCMQFWDVSRNNLKSVNLKKL